GDGVGGSQAPTPTVVAGRIGQATPKHNKKGKPIGKPVVEITLTFSTAMDPGTLDNAGNYRVAWSSTKRVKKRVQTALHTISVLSATAGPSNTLVTLVTSARKTKFARGGQVSIVSPGSIRSAAGAPLGGPTVFL